MADGVVKRVRTRHFQNAKEQGIPITGLTSYDALTAGVFDRAGIDFLLVGDSAGNNVLGYDTTLPVTVDQLIPLTRAVAGAVQRALVVADMPFGSYETGPDEALHTAFRFMKETGAHAVKLEGGVRSAEQIRRIVADFDFDLRDTTSRPAGLPYTVIKHLGPRKTSEQVNALAWFLSNGLYDDNYKLKAMVERMVAAGVDGDAHLVAGSLTGSIA